MLMTLYSPASAFRAGKSVEQMAAELNAAKENLEKVQGTWTAMMKLNKALKNSLLIRLHRWQEFRRHIALRCRLIFAFHLSRRGYYGKVLFNHEAGTLTLRVSSLSLTLHLSARKKVLI